MFHVKPRLRRTSRADPVCLRPPGVSVEPIRGRVVRCTSAGGVAAARRGGAPAAVGVDGHWPVAVVDARRPTGLPDELSPISEAMGGVEWSIGGGGCREPRGAAASCSRGLAVWWWKGRRARRRRSGWVGVRASGAWAHHPLALRAAAGRSEDRVGRGVGVVGLAIRVVPDSRGAVQQTGWEAPVCRCQRRGQRRCTAHSEPFGGRVRISGLVAPPGPWKRCAAFHSLPLVDWSSTARCGALAC